MKKVIFLAVLLAAGVRLADAHEAKTELPAGPIRDRHELMERIGRNAKVIGDAVKSAELGPVAGAADAIKTDAGRTLSLFPAGSTHGASRAKAEIWTDWATFEAQVKDLESAAAGLADTARGGGDVEAAAKKMFGACKNCHDRFRTPEK